MSNAAIVAFKQSAIKGVATLLTEKGTFQRVLDAVNTVDDPNTPGNEKKDAVLKQLKVIGLDLASWLTNLLIELAVAWIKVEQQKSN